jgi:hypothetical protein
MKDEVYDLYASWYSTPWYRLMVNGALDVKFTGLTSHS